MLFIQQSYGYNNAMEKTEKARPNGASSHLYFVIGISRADKSNVCKYNNILSYIVTARRMMSGLRALDMARQNSWPRESA